MTDARLTALAEDLAAARGLDAPLEARLHEALRGVGLPYAGSFGSAEAALALVEEALPGWAVSLEGTASRAHGHWTCTLRRTRATDNDAVLGTAHGPCLVPTLLAALLRALAAGAHA